MRNGEFANSPGQEREPREPACEPCEQVTGDEFAEFADSRTAETASDLQSSQNSPIRSADSANCSQPDGTGTVENPDGLDPNGWPYCAGGCGLGVNPAIADSDRHGFCS